MNEKSKDNDLGHLVESLKSDLETSKAPCIEGLTDNLHECAPSLPKARWTRLGDALKEAERPSVVSIPGDKWISLRCDGTGFSRFLETLRVKGILNEGFSDTLSRIMQDCCLALMEKFNAVYGFTQSDEMTILIAPANWINGVQHCHPYNGRVQKLCSLAAATVTARFNYELTRLYLNAGEVPDTTLATFDCRVGMYNTMDEAVSLLLWRAYDAGINGIQDAVHHQKGHPERKRVMKLPTGDKLRWLLVQALLPLPRHQREGTFYVKRKVKLHTTNRATGEPVTCLRSRFEHVPGNLIRLFVTGNMFPPDDELLEDRF